MRNSGSCLRGALTRCTICALQHSVVTAADACLQSDKLQQLCRKTHLENVRLIDICGIAKWVGAAVDQQLAMPRRVEERLQAAGFMLAPDTE